MVNGNAIVRHRIANWVWVMWDLAEFEYLVTPDVG